MLMADPMTMSRLKAYRRNASAIEDIKTELSGKYVPTVSAYALHRPTHHTAHA